MTIHNQNPARGTPATFGVRPDANLPADVLAAVNSLFGGKAPFGGPLVAGQISQSAELEQRGLPGGHTATSISESTPALDSPFGSTGISHSDSTRFNHIAGSQKNFTTVGSRIGLHF